MACDSASVRPSAEPVVLLAHGGGGRMSRRLVKELFRRHFRSEELDRDHDGAYLGVPDAELAFSTDGFVVSPPFFPGGDIGSLAIHGTVNDLASCGAAARWISAAFVLEEGFPMADLDRIVASMARAAERSGVVVVTGDTKVVERGKADGVFVTTSGIGVSLGSPRPTPRAVRVGDRVIVSGEIGLHGMAVMSIREGIGFDAPIESDSAPLGELVASIYAAGLRPRCLRDPTRGGVAATLSEIAEASGTGVLLDEEAVPVSELVRGACEILGLDPLFVACEGRMLFIVAPEEEAAALEILRRHPLGAGAVAIGRVVAEAPGDVLIRTGLGGVHILDIPAGDELPRIC